MNMVLHRFDIVDNPSIMPVLPFYGVSNKSGDWECRQVRGHIRHCLLRQRRYHGHAVSW